MPPSRSGTLRSQVSIPVVPANGDDLSDSSSDAGSPAPLPLPGTVKNNYKLLVAEEVDVALLADPKTTPIIDVEVWESVKHGLRVAYVTREGPLIDARFGIIRENFDDAGKTAALGKLCLMGTEANPSKDFLNVLGAKLMSTGLKLHHRSPDFPGDLSTLQFEASSASGPGFLQMLPLYVEQLLYPLITEDEMLTEIYNSDINGKQGGALFNLAREAQDDRDRSFARAMRHTIFPEGSGFRYGSLGISDAIASLDAEEMKKEVPTPDELLILVIGSGVARDDLLKTLDKDVGSMIASHKQSQSLLKDLKSIRRPPRPFVDTPTAHFTPQSLQARIPAKPVHVTYTGKDDDDGEVRLIWLGPDIHDNFAAGALDMIEASLTSDHNNALYARNIIGENSPVQEVDFTRVYTDPTLVVLTLRGVPLKRLDGIADQFLAGLEAIARDGLSLSALDDAMESSQHQQISTVESRDDLNEYLAHNVFTGAVFGSPDGSLIPKMMEDTHVLKTLQGWKPAEWLRLFKDIFLNPKRPPLVLVGNPSSDVQSYSDIQLQKDSSAIRRRGGLAAADAKLKRAIGVISAEVDSTALAHYEVPDVDSIHWPEVQSAKSHGIKGAHLYSDPAQDAISRDPADLPYCVQFDHFKSNFIEISVFFFPEPLPDFIDKRCGVLLPFWTKGLFNVPVTRHADANGKFPNDGLGPREMSAAEIGLVLSTLTVDYHVECVRERVEVYMKVPKENYQEAISWLRDILTQSVWNPDSLLLAANEVAQDVADFKSSASAIAFDGYRNLLIKPHSVEYSTNRINADQNLREYVPLLQSDPVRLSKRMRALEKIMLDNCGFRISVRGDITGLKEPTTAWAKQFIPFKPIKSADLIYPTPQSVDRLTHLAQKMSGRRLSILTAEALFNTSGWFATKAPSSFDDPDLPALMIALHILNGPSGLLQRSLTNKGLCFSVEMMHMIELGVIHICLMKTPDIIEAYAACGKIVRDICDGVTRIDIPLVESARSGYALDLARDQPDAAAAAQVSFGDTILLGYPQFWQHSVLTDTKMVGPDDVVHVMQKIVRPLFNPATSLGAVGTSKLNGAKLKASFTELGYTDSTVWDFPPPAPKAKIHHVHDALVKAADVAHNIFQRSPLLTNLANNIQERREQRRERRASTSGGPQVIVMQMQ